MTDVTLSNFLFINMATVDDWNWDEVIPADEISLADEIKGMSEIHLSKKTGRVTTIVKTD